jgi:hypothetical protein
MLLTGTGTWEIPATGWADVDLVGVGLRHVHLQLQADLALEIALGDPTDEPEEFMSYF